MASLYDFFQGSTGPLWGKSPVTDGFPSQRARSDFAIFIVARLNYLVNKQSSCMWFDTPWCSHDVTTMRTLYNCSWQNTNNWCTWPHSVTPSWLLSREALEKPSAETLARHSIQLNRSSSAHWQQCKHSVRVNVCTLRLLNGTFGLFWVILDWFYFCLQETKEKKRYLTMSRPIMGYGSIRLWMIVSC